PASTTTSTMLAASTPLTTAGTCRRAAAASAIGLFEAVVRAARQTEPATGSLPARSQRWPPRWRLGRRRQSHGPRIRDAAGPIPLLALVLAALTGQSRQDMAMPGSSPATWSDDSQWQVVEDRFDPSRLRAAETIFTIGNGRFSTRGSLEEGHRGDHAATLMHG